MKRRPRLVVKPVLPPRQGIVNSEAESVATSDEGIVRPEAESVATSDEGIVRPVTEAAPVTPEEASLISTVETSPCHVSVVISDPRAEDSATTAGIQDAIRNHQQLDIIPSEREHTVTTEIGLQSRKRTMNNSADLSLGNNLELLSAKSLIPIAENVSAATSSSTDITDSALCNAQKDPTPENMMVKESQESVVSPQKQQSFGKITRRPRMVVKPVIPQRDGNVKPAAKATAASGDSEVPLACTAEASLSSCQMPVANSYQQVENSARTDGKQNAVKNQQQLDIIHSELDKMVDVVVCPHPEVRTTSDAEVLPFGNNMELLPSTQGLIPIPENDSATTLSDTDITDNTLSNAHRNPTPEKLTLKANQESAECQQKQQNLGKLIRRPRMVVKPVIPSKSGDAKPAAKETTANVIVESDKTVSVTTQPNLSKSITASLSANPATSSNDLDESPVVSVSQSADIRIDMDSVDNNEQQIEPISESPDIFTKMKSNFQKSTRLQESDSTADDDPYVPPCVTQTDVVAPVMEENIACEELVVMISPERAERAAAKIIERKLKEKRKKRTLENLNGPIDSSKVCLRDLIYMNPVNNPMKSSSATKSTSNVSILSQSTPEKKPEDELPHFDAPQVMIGPDGNIIVNQSSLVIERQKEDTSNLETVDETEMIRIGYPKKNRTRSWSAKETKKFFAALSMIGTDFSLMCRLFPSRDRADLKRKFKREEKVHRAMVETALKERRSLDITLLAEPSEDEEIQTKKPKQPGRRGPRKKKQASGGEAENNESVGGKENEPQTDPAIMQRGNRKRKHEVDKQAGKKSKKKKSRYYEESSDEAEKEKNEAIGSGNGADGDVVMMEEEEDEELVTSHRTLPKIPSPHTSDEDDDEVINYISNRPTRSGRIPRPTRTYNPVKFTDVEASANQSPSPIKQSQESLLPIRRLDSNRLPPVTVLFSQLRSGTMMSPPPSSPIRSANLTSPPPFSSPPRVPISSPPPLSGSPSSQVPFLLANIAGLENLPPGKQLVFITSPVLPNDSGEPQQPLLHLFMASTTSLAADASDGRQESMQMHSTPVGNDPGTISMLRPPNFVNASLSNTQENFTNCRNFSEMVQLIGDVGRNRTNSQGSMNLDETYGNDTSVSPMLSNTALEYCVSQVAGLTPLVLDLLDNNVAVNSAVTKDNNDNGEFEGNITDVIEQDDGTLVIVAEPVDSVSSESFKQSSDILS